VRRRRPPDARLIGIALAGLLKITQARMTDAASPRSANLAALHKQPDTGGSRNEHVCL